MARRADDGDRKWPPILNVPQEMPNCRPGRARRDGKLMGSKIARISGPARKREARQGMCADVAIRPCARSAPQTQAISVGRTSHLRLARTERKEATVGRTSQL